MKLIISAALPSTLDLDTLSSYLDLVPFEPFFPNLGEWVDGFEEKFVLGWVGSSYMRLVEPNHSYFS